jgi:nucleotide-binding universal stress UspA family protein
MRAPAAVFARVLLPCSGPHPAHPAQAFAHALTVRGSSVTVETLGVAEFSGKVSAGAFDLVLVCAESQPGFFLDGMTDAVLRLSPCPVLVVHDCEDAAPDPFGVVLVAVDDSAPSDAALALAACLARDWGCTIVACNAVESGRIIESAAAAGYGFNPVELAEEIRRDAVATVTGALARAGLAASTPMVIVDGEPARAVVATAKARGAGLIIAGTHGRRGIVRFALGSVAGDIARASTVPVLVVPAARASV